MKTAVRLLVSLLLAAVLCLAALPGVCAKSAAPEVTAKSAVLYSLTHGSFLYAKDADTRRSPASLTKLMTGLLLYESVPDLSKEQITVSSRAIRSLDGTGAVLTGVKAGERFVARDLLALALLLSSNEAANAIAEHLDGSVAAFAEHMNRRAAELGMTNTHFVNANGLYDTKHYSTAHDLALLAAAFFSVEELRTLSAAPKYTLPATNKSKARTVTNGNPMLLQNGEKAEAGPYRGAAYYDPAVTGSKTGYLTPAGRCMALCARKGTEQLLCILLKTPTEFSDGAGRSDAGDASALLRYGFTDFSERTLLRAGDALGNLSADGLSLPVHVKDPFTALLPASLTVSDCTLLPRFSLTAPVQKGQVLGQAMLCADGVEWGTVTLVADADIAPAPSKASSALPSSAASVSSAPAQDGGISWWLIPLLALSCAVILGFAALLLHTARRRKK